MLPKSVLSVATAVWSAAPVDREPLVLAHWQYVATGAGTRHFVGYNWVRQEGRLSSRIVVLDHTKRMGVTQSLRTYLLEGEPLPGDRLEDDPAYVWRFWMLRNGVKNFEVVTEKALRGE